MHPCFFSFAWYLHTFGCHVLILFTKFWKKSAKNSSKLAEHPFHEFTNNFFFQDFFCQWVPKSSNHFDLVISTVMFITKQRYTLSRVMSGVWVFFLTKTFMVLSSGILIKSEYSFDDFINIFGLHFEIAFTL